MTTTRNVKPVTVRMVGIDWTIGEPTGGWGDLNDPEWKRVETQFPVYRQYKHAISPRDFIAAWGMFMRRVDGGRWANNSLNALVRRFPLVAGVKLPPDMTHDAPVSHAERQYESQAMKWARQAESEDADFARYARSMQFLAENGENVGDPDEPASRPSRTRSREPLFEGSSREQRRAAPSSLPEGRRRRHLLSLVKQGLFGSVDEADAEVPRRERSR